MDILDRVFPENSPLVDVFRRAVKGTENMDEERQYVRTTLGFLFRARLIQH